MEQLLFWSIIYLSDKSPRKNWASKKVQLKNTFYPCKQHKKSRATKLNKIASELLLSSKKQHEVLERRMARCYKYGWWNTTFPSKHPLTSKHCVGENRDVRTVARWHDKSLTCLSPWGPAGGLAYCISQSSLHWVSKASSLTPWLKDEQMMRPSGLMLSSLM